MKSYKKSEVLVRVEYEENPEEARAALELLREGFRRGLRKAIAEKESNTKKDGVA
ncbi:MAG: hypothetical protein K0R39_5019 [Symbiobacteriaceae bacterium]|jgi:hypothetical protein|nr:hypothetical protein [Symbiobacteriaceae bacterium]